MPYRSTVTFRLFVRFPMLALVLGTGVMGVWGKRGVLDWNRIHRQKQELVQRLQQTESEKEKIEREVHLLETDSSEQERVVRQMLGYVKTNEVVIEFQ